MCVAINLADPVMSTLVDNTVTWACTRTQLTLNTWKLIDLPVYFTRSPPQRRGVEMADKYFFSSEAFFLLHFNGHCKNAATVQCQPVFADIFNVCNDGNIHRQHTNDIYMLPTWQSIWHAGTSHYIEGYRSVTLIYSSLGCRREANASCECSSSSLVQRK